MDNVALIINKYKVLSERLDEATLRLWAAVEARSLGRGGVSTVAKAIPTVSKSRIRTPGGGRKKLVDKDPSLPQDLEKLVDIDSRGDPVSPLRWTCKSTPRLAKELEKQGHKVSQRTVCDLLTELGYSLQATRKTHEGGKHPDRDAQFQHIAHQVAMYQTAGDPVISVDTKKKELIGDFKNNGQEWRPKGKPEEVRVYDFIDAELGKVAP